MEMIVKGDKILIKLENKNRKYDSRKKREKNEGVTKKPIPLKGLLKSS